MKRGIRILVIDDNEEILKTIAESIREFLEPELKLELVLESDPRRGLKLINTNKTINLVLTDGEMPFINGIKIIRSCLEKKLPVVLMTGSEQISAEAAKLIGHDAILRKPFKLDSLRRTIKLSLSNK